MERKQSKRGRPPGKAPASKTVKRQRRINERVKLQTAKAQKSEEEAKTSVTKPRSDLSEAGTSGLPVPRSDLPKRESSGLPEPASDVLGLNTLLDTSDIPHERPEPDTASLDVSPRAASNCNQEKTPMDATSFAVDGVTGEEIGKLLAERVRVLLPTEWTVQFFPVFIYVLLATVAPYRVKRAICFYFNGEISVEASCRTLRETHEIYSDPMMKSPGPLSYETLECFAVAIRRAAYAVQSYKRCVGVDADNSIEEWTEHPACRLDDQEIGAEKVLRTQECSLILPRTKKRCTLCSQYQEVLRKREARRREHPSGEVDENTPHSLLSTSRLKCVLKSKQTIIRRQAAELRRMKERVAKLTEEGGI